jgi:hypothetical protein
MSSGIASPKRSLLSQVKVGHARCGAANPGCGPAFQRSSWRKAGLRAQLPAPFRSEFIRDKRLDTTSARMTRSAPGFFQSCILASSASGSLDFHIPQESLTSQSAAPAARIATRSLTCFAALYLAPGLVKPPSVKQKRYLIPDRVSPGKVPDLILPEADRRLPH